jgi:peptidoglycan/LPS O-acetylase OafA/YrhL
MITASKSRIEVLDSLRAIAAMAVLVFHTSYHFNFGRYGVQLFFIISGFVIFKTVESTKTVKEFAIKRFFRLYPAYWIAIIITTIFVNIFSKTKHVSIKEFLFNLTMFQEHFKIENVDWSYWSLTPELFFYFYMAVIIFFKATRFIFPICIAWLCIILLNYFLKIEDYFIWIKFFNIRHGQLFIAGIMFYRIFYKKGNLIHNYIILAITFITSILVYTPQYNLRDILIVIPITYILFFLFIYEKLNFLKLKPLIFLGTISYPLYLIHQRIAFTIKEHYDFTSNPLLIILLIIIFISVAYCIHILIETPTQKICKRLLTPNPFSVKPNKV